MIPTHELADKKHPRIIVNELGTLVEYDFTSPHRHEYFEFFVFERGGGSHNIDFESFEIHDHAIHIVAPGRVHQVNRSLDSNGYVFLFEADVFMNDPLIADFLYNHTCYDIHEFPPTYIVDKELHAQIWDLALRIGNDYLSTNPFKHEFLLHNLSLLFIQCMRTRPAVIPMHTTTNGKIYQEFRQLLYRQFRTLKKVKDYAALLFVSEKQLNEIVKAQTGASASTIIYKQIIMEARRLLNMGLTAKEVAFNLEFEDPGHFSKFFKTQTGLSPSEFAKIHS